MNTTVKESIGVSPAQLIFGNAIDLDRGLFYDDKQLDGDDQVQLTPTVKQYIDQLLRAQAGVLSVARKYQLKADEKHLQKKEEKKSKRKAPLVFSVNDYVLAQYPAGLGGVHRPPSKFHTRWQGPLRIVEIKGDMFTLQNLVSAKQSKHHISTIAPFRENASIMDPKDVALRDTDEFYIDHIITHDGDLTKKSTLLFKIRWRGYTEAEDTWEKWSGLSSTDALHDYLRRIGKEKLIPKKFRENIDEVA
jgi:hypothetical protein